MTPNYLKEELRSEFETLFPKDPEASEGIRPSKSRRSEALVLWAKWEIILMTALSSQKAELKKKIEGMKKPEYMDMDEETQYFPENEKYNQALQKVIDYLKEGIRV